MRTDLHRVAEDRYCCDSRCENGEHCPVYYACAVERSPRYTWWARLLKWMGL